MNERERERLQPGRPAGDGAAGGQLDAARSGGERLLRAADEAIARALSSDSQKFLEATRQSGGQ